jgi:hypothetical protein
MLMTAADPDNGSFSQLSILLVPLEPTIDLGARGDR